MPTWAEVHALFTQLEQEHEDESEWWRSRCPEQPEPEVPIHFSYLLHPLGERLPPPLRLVRPESGELYEWHGGADACEVVGFDIYPGFPGDGAMIPHLPDEKLAAYAAQTAAWLRGRPTAWLRAFGPKLSHEIKLRGVAL